MDKSFKVSSEKVIDELIEELIEEQKEPEKKNGKIMKHEIIERLNIKQIESEILHETKVLDEIKTELRKLKTTIVKKGF